MADVLTEDFSDVTTADMIAEVRRELALRDRVYPAWIKSGRLKQATADRDVRRMRAVLRTLLILRQAVELL